MHVEVHVGTGSVHFVRERRAFGGKKSAVEGEMVCLPHGQWVRIVGDLGHASGTGDGTWQGFEHW
jgi:hypothetical protein